MKVTFLGTGTSCGVPFPTCQCEVCTSKDPRDNRLRCSCLVETSQGQNLLIDCGPDFRQQALRAGLTHIDALLVTHNHFDHVAGLDDLRAFCYESPLATYADATVSATFIDKYDYIFVHRYPGVPKMDLHPTAPEEVLTFGDTVVRPIQIFHGKLPIYGWRVGDLAYLTDCTSIPEQEWSKLQGIDTLIIDALRWTPHPTHFSVEQALEVVHRMQPRQTYFTHMGHAIGLHAQTDTKLPAGVHLAYDGLVIEVNDAPAR
ncbi:MAG: MBL fold metallo-hydrolase [Bacteroidales bacterium]|nr:MBL fold metallo-hydrolase [Bacteroidales bacterium]